MNAKLLETISELVARGYSVDTISRKLGFSSRDYLFLTAKYDSDRLNAHHLGKGAIPKLINWGAIRQSKEDKVSLVSDLL